MIVTNRVIARASFAAILAPLVIAAAIRVVEPAPLPGPSSASAEQDAEARAASAGRKIKITPEQTAAAEHIASLDAGAPVRNLFFYPRAGEQRIDVAPDPVANPYDVAPTFEITSIMKTRSGPVALINGRLRRVGDEVAPGWTVQSINDLTRSVTLTGPDQRTQTIVMPTGLGR